MSSKPYVVMGEAQESDTEEEIDSSTPSNEPCKGKIVCGEAPESDEENCTNSGSLDSVSSAVSALSLSLINEKKKTSKKHQSILVKKLCERNSSLHKNITDFIEQTASDALSELNATNRRLLKCQLKLQEGTDFLRTLNSNLSSIDANLQMLLSTEYLPVIKLEKNTVLTKPP